MTTYVLHLHHKVLFETLTEPIKNRIDYINTFKPEHERETRLSAMRILTPSEVKTIPKGVMKKYEAYDKAWGVWDKTWEAYYKTEEAYVKAREAYDKAMEAYDKTTKAYYKARGVWDKTWEAYDKAMEAYDKTTEAYDKARGVWDKAWKACDKAEDAFVDACNTPAMIKWHKKICKYDGCPWDGETLFPNFIT